MNVYFLRHGEFQKTEPIVYPTNETPLSTEGRKQIGLVDNKVCGLGIELILSSDLARAVETAKIVNRNIKVELRINGLFSERKRPSEIVGRDVGNVEVKNIIQIINEKYHTPGYHYSDEENFSDLKSRAREALKYLEEIHVRKLLVVSHSEILAMIFLLIAFGEGITSIEYTQRKHLFAIKTAEIVCFERSDGIWRRIGDMMKR